MHLKHRPWCQDSTGSALSLTGIINPCGLRIGISSSPFKTNIVFSRLNKWVDFVLVIDQGGQIVSSKETFHVLSILATPMRTGIVHIFSTSDSLAGYSVSICKAPVFLQLHWLTNVTSPGLKIFSRRSRLIFWLPIIRYVLHSLIKGYLCFIQTLLSPTNNTLRYCSFDWVCDII